MKLQDYIKYYIGCEVIVDGKERKLLTGGIFVPNEVNQIYYNIEEDDGFSMPYNEDANDAKPRVKPILRRLEDMTRDEMKAIWQLIVGRPFPESGKILWFDKETSTSCKRWCMMSGIDRVGIELNGNVWADCDLQHIKFNPHMVAHYLLQQTFDLFGLINAGLAIDIKTI